MVVVVVVVVVVPFDELLGSSCNPDAERIPF